MRLIIMGPPGAGKGSQAAILKEKFDIPHISTGDIFRRNVENGTELGKKAKEYMDSGQLVPDELTADIVRDRLQQEDCKKGFLLDGYPRTLPQAEMLEKILNEMDIKIDKVISLNVSDETIMKRMTGRRICPDCDAIYNIFNLPPKEEGKCDVCNAELMQRVDDKAETVKERLDVYHKQTEPLLGFYKNKGILVEVEGKDKLEDTTKEVLDALVDKKKTLGDDDVLDRFF